MKEMLKRTPIIILALIIMAVAVNMFLAPHQIAAGGVSGLGVLVEKALGINRAIVVLVLNALLLLLALKSLDREVFIKSVIGSMLLPVALYFVPDVMVVQDRFLAVIFGSLLFAIAVSMLYRIEASSGGTTIPPLIMQKRFGLNTPIGLLITDLFVVVFNIFVFGFDSFLFAVLSLIITAVAMAYIETGLRRDKAVIITSETKIYKIQNAIVHSMKTRIAMLQVADGMTGNPRPNLIVVLDDSDYPKLIHMVRRYDKNASIIAFNIAAAGKESFSVKNSKLPVKGFGNHKLKAEI